MYAKMIADGFIIAVGTGIVGDEITEEEYNAILDAINSAPKAPSGYEYRLRADLEWELVELPPAPDPGKEEIEDSEALEIILGGVVL